jgi:hypothetical protein
MLTAAVCILLIGASPSSAELDPDPGPQEDDIPLVSDEHERKIDDTHQQASQLLVSAADWLDSFFDDDRYILEENTTRLQLRLSCCIMFSTGTGPCNTR